MAAVTQTREVIIRGGHQLNEMCQVHRENGQDSIE